MAAADRGWAYGVRVEWADVDATQEAPPGWWWDSGCTSVVNSGGTANDPLRLLVPIGGALVSPVAASPEQLVSEVADVWLDFLPTINYRCNLRVDVFIPGLAEDLAAMRQITAYTRRHLVNLWPAIDPLDSLTPIPSTEAERRMVRDYRDHTLRPVRRYLLPDRRHEVRMAASTASQFLAAGTWRFHGDRESVMVVGDGAVQLRCFAHPTGTGDLLAAVEFSRAWVDAALRRGDAFEVAMRWTPLLPRQLPFDPELERGWLMTNFRDRTREEAVESLARWKKRRS